MRAYAALPSLASAHQQGLATACAACAPAGRPENALPSPGAGAPRSGPADLRSSVRGRLPAPFSDSAIVDAPVASTIAARLTNHAESVVSLALRVSITGLSSSETPGIAISLS